MRLAIVVGHDVKGKGATSVAPLNLQEYDFNLQIAQDVYRKAMEHGIACRIFLRNGIGIRGVYEQVAQWADKNTVCIELHFNSFNGKAQGTETLFDKSPTDSIEFAREIHNGICELFKRKDKTNRGLKLIEQGDRGYLNLNLCQIPSCIVEPFFGDNTEDAKLAHKYMNLYGDTLVNSTIAYFKNKEKIMAMN